jgi:SAM-dependent methyltransferase
MTSYGADSQQGVAMERSHRDFLATHETAIPAADARLSLFIREYERFRSSSSASLRLLDVGCGKRPVLLRYVHSDDEYWGCDFYETGTVAAPNYVQVDFNEESLVTKLDAPFDVIFCGEVLEHLFSPDALVTDLRELVSPRGIAIFSTPNLGYYVNRLLLLAGISPLYLENSAEVKLGRRTPRLGQGNRTEGHIRLFTYRALREFLERHGFEIVRVLPTVTWNFALDRLVCRYSRSLAPNNVFVVKKSMSPGRPGTGS